MATKIKVYTDMCHLPVVNKTAIWCGMADSGKTTAAFRTFQKLQCRAEPAFAKIVVLSPTANYQDTWKYLPPGDIYSEPSMYASVIQHIMTHQEQKVEKSARQNILVLVDDCVGRMTGEEGKEFSRLLTTLATSGRWLNITLWILTQSLRESKTVTPVVRASAACIVSGIIGDSYRDSVEAAIGLDKKSAKLMTTEAWSEPYRFICYDASSGGGAERHTFVKVNLAEVIPFGMKYRTK